MTEWEVFTGATHDDAVEGAVRRFGIGESDMEIEVVDATDDSEHAVRVRAAERSDADESVSEEDREREQAELLDRQKDVVLDFVVDLVESFDLEGEIGAEIREGVLHVDVNGDDLGSLIGRRGKTLGALAEITKTVVQRRTASRVRLNLDVQGYRVRRREVLERYASELATDVKESGVEKALEPMSAAERKAVHDSVAAINGVRSYSEGSEPRRNVVISPT